MEKKTILVVEDENPLKEILSEKLSKDDFNVLGASDGEEGLALALEKNPDLIVLDLLMPKMGGVEMLRRLRANDRGRDTKVLVLSNLNESDHVAEALELGISGFLVKSDWRLEDIALYIKQTLNIE